MNKEESTKWSMELDCSDTETFEIKTKTFTARRSGIHKFGEKEVIEPINVFASNSSGPITIGPPTKPTEVHVMEWIRVGDQAPPTENPIIIYLDDEAIWAILSYQEDGWDGSGWYEMFNHEYGSNDFKYWMPLPDPPTTKLVETGR